MNKIGVSLKRAGGKKMRFPTYEYLGYQIGIRNNNPKITEGEAKKLVSDWKYIFGFILTGRRLFLDFWIVSKKKERFNRPKMIYEWKLCYPDGKQVEDIGGRGMADMTAKTAHKGVLNLGHFSIPGAYRIEFKITNDINSEALTEIVDFDVYSFGNIEFYIFQLIILVILTGLFSLIARACGMPNG